MWDAIITEITLAPGVAWPVVVIRMLGAALLCGLIGFEREASRRPAGLRTHMLVGVASCLYSLLALSLLDRTSEFSDTVRMDPLRLIEAVTGGVAFLAAGMIVFAQGKVRGLTTGSSMWLAAGVGLACGVGEWAIAGLTTITSLAIIVALRKLERQAGTHQKQQKAQEEEEAEQPAQADSGSA